MRPSKPGWIKGKGEEALKIVYEIMNDTTAPLPIRLQACRMLAEFDLGKPHQMVMVDAEVETRHDPLEGMSLKERMEAGRQTAVTIASTDRAALEEIVTQCKGEILHILSTNKITV